MRICGSTRRLNTPCVPQYIVVASLASRDEMFVMLLHDSQESLEINVPQYAIGSQSGPKYTARRRWLRLNLQAGTRSAA
jgi:hypothetical protein